MDLLLPILDALQYVHGKNLLHRDVKPSNLYLEEDGTPLLLDFGAARSALSERTQSASLVHTPGYAPFEQYSGSGQGPWTDVYAAAATLYKLLTGVVPPKAFERTAKDGLVAPERLVPEITQGVSRAVLAGLALQVEKRPRDAGELRKLLVAKPPAVAAPPPPAAPVPPGPGKAVPWPILESGARRSGPPPGWLTAAGLGIALMLGVGLGVWRPWQEEEPTANRPGLTEAPATTEQPTVGPQASPPPPSPVAGQVWENPADGQSYVWIPPDTFQMGCTPGDAECWSTESPRHQVTLAKGIWLGQTEVTVAAYRRLAQGRMPEAPIFNSGWKEEEHPIVNVSWDDARAHCGRAGGRLPSEAEWEYAARGGHEAARYPWGKEAPVCEAGARNGARFDDTLRCNDAGTAPVRTYGANGYRLYDMAGNVWEWCEDSWHYSYTGAPSNGTAWLTGDSTSRVVRGGSWYVYPKVLRVSSRNRFTFVNRGDDVGFRCARDAFP